LLARIYDPQSPDFRHYVSVADFASRFAPSADDYNAAAAFFQANGMTVQRLSANRLLIDVESSVTDAERVFHVTMGLYRHPTENRLFIAPDREPTLDLAVPVNEIIGLDDLFLPKPRVVKSASADGSTPTGSGPHGYFIGSDIRAAYYGGVALTGFDQSLGLMELQGYNLSDVQAYFAKVSQPLDVNVVGISTDGSPLGCGTGCNDIEQALDIEYAISMAPGLKQVQVYVANSPESVMAAMASDDTSLQLSTSWGWHKHLVTDETLMKEMAAQGQSYLTASGDYSSLQASGPWPEEDPFITAVGGTDLTTNGPGGTWAAETGWSGSAGGPSLEHQCRQWRVGHRAQRAGHRRRREHRQLSLRPGPLRWWMGRHQLCVADLGGVHCPRQPAGGRRGQAARGLPQPRSLRHRCCHLCACLSR
jgi:subtilase family serine protease